jgi:hypothetical protein
VLWHDDNADNAHNKRGFATNRFALFAARIAFGGYYIKAVLRAVLAGFEPATTN